jgi:hypothetical protein
VREPTRAAAVFAATLNATVPLPSPVAPDVIVIHGTVLAAVQEQPVAALTLTGFPAPPAAPIGCAVDPIE